MQPALPDVFRQLLDQISERFREGQSSGARAVNVQLLETYWAIGKYIVEFEQGGEAKAKYGSKLIQTLSKDLSQLHGKGFSLSNLKRIRQFFLQHPNGATVDSVAPFELVALCGTAQVGERRNLRAGLLPALFVSITAGFKVEGGLKRGFPS